MKRTILIALLLVTAVLGFADVNIWVGADLSHQVSLPETPVVDQGLVPTLGASYFATLNRYTDLGFGLDIAVPGFGATGLVAGFVHARFPYQSGEISVTPSGRVGYTSDLSSSTDATTGPYFGLGLEIGFEGLFFVGVAYQGHVFPIPDAVPAGLDYRSRLSVFAGIPLF